MKKRKREEVQGYEPQRTAFFPNPRNAKKRQRTQVLHLLLMILVRKKQRCSQVFEDKEYLVFA